MSRQEVPHDHSCIMHVRARRMRVVGSSLPGWPSPIPYRVRARRMSVAQHFYVLHVCCVSVTIYGLELCGKMESHRKGSKRGCEESVFLVFPVFPLSL